MKIQIYIERLILDGLPFEHGQELFIQRAFETELTRLIAENNLTLHWETGIATPALNGNTIQLTSGSSPAQVGTQIAQSLYSGIGNLR
jgi:hypothetical protein